MEKMEGGKIESFDAFEGAENAGAQASRRTSITENGFEKSDGNQESVIKPQKKRRRERKRAVRGEECSEVLAEDLQARELDGELAAQIQEGGNVFERSRRRENFGSTPSVSKAERPIKKKYNKNKKFDVLWNQPCSSSLAPNGHTTDENLQSENGRASVRAQAYFEVAAEPEPEPFLGHLETPNNWDYGQPLEYKKRRHRRRRTAGNKKIVVQSSQQEQLGDAHTDQLPDVGITILVDERIKETKHRKESDEEEEEEQEADVVSLPDSPSEEAKNADYGFYDPNFNFNFFDMPSISEEPVVTENVLCAERSSEEHLINFEGQSRLEDEVDQKANRTAPTVAKPRINKPLIIAKDIFDGFTPEFNKAIFLQNGRVEVMLQKSGNKDYILICFFECDGGDKPNKVTRGMYKVSSSVVVSADVDEKNLMVALTEGARLLETASANLFSQPDQPLPYGISECSLPYLAKHFISPLKETDSKPERYERAIYYCAVCYNHFFSVDHAITHCDGREHIDAEKDHAAMQRLHSLPSPSEAQIASVSELLERELAHAQLGRDAYENANVFIQKLTNILRESVHEECSLVLFGSYYVRNATPKSNMNLSLVHPSSLQRTTVLFRLLSILNNEQTNEASGISAVTKDFRSSAPSVRICVAAGKIHAEPVTVVISTQSSRSVLSSRYIELFTRIRSQFLELSTLFRYWAEICSLDNVTIGGLPRFAFDVMLIHYLQVKGYLPFPFEMVPESKEAAETAEGSEENEEKKIPNYQEDAAEILRVFGEDERNWNLGALWIDLLRYYTLERSNGNLVQVRWRVPEEKTEAKRYNKKHIGIEDPVAPERICQPSNSFSSYLNNCFLCTFLHFAIPRTLQGPLISYSLKSEEQLSVKKGRRKTNKEEDASGSPKDDCADASLKADLSPTEELHVLGAEGPKPEGIIQDMPVIASLQPTEMSFIAEENEQLRESDNSLSDGSMTKCAEDAVLSPISERSSPVEDSYDYWLPDFLFPDEEYISAQAADESVLERISNGQFPDGDLEQVVDECATNQIRRTYSRDTLLRLSRSADPDTENQAVDEVSAVLEELLATLEATTSITYSPSNSHQTDASFLEIENTACQLDQSGSDKHLKQIIQGEDIYPVCSVISDEITANSSPCLNEQLDCCELPASPTEEHSCFEAERSESWQRENDVLKEIGSEDLIMEHAENSVLKRQSNILLQEGSVEDATVEVTEMDISRRIYSRDFMLERLKFADHRIVSVAELRKVDLFNESASSSLSQIPKEVGSSDTVPVKKVEGAARTRNVHHVCRYHLEVPEFNLEAVRARWLKLGKDDFAFFWDLSSFTNNAKPEVRCSSCGIAGHLSKDCPELKVPAPKDLEPLSDRQTEFLGIVVHHFFDRLRIQPEHEMMMENLRADLERTLQTNYRPDCRLSLFGSASNGFGLVRSDADICLRFGSEENSPEDDPAMVVIKISSIVKRMNGVRSVKPIVSAKVPITKIEFDDRYNGLEADVSLYNVLALENTRLLRSYCMLDERVQQLGVALKHWAGCCEIRDASRGSLSSYSYTVMLIHYLQRTRPPVLPFLQQISPPGEEKTTNMVDGYDVYFCDAEKSGWKSENREAVGTLWFGFFDYFAREFDFEDQVIQIRQEEPLWKLDKGWQTRPIAIEDPFELKHNLSSGVHSKTLTYIRKSFVQSRQRFGTVLVPGFLNDRNVAQFARNLFSRCRVEGGPPLDRNCCFRCHGLGHFADSCPNLLNGYKKAGNESGGNGGGKRGRRNGSSFDGRGRGGHPFTGARANGPTPMENHGLFDRYGRSPFHGNAESYRRRNAYMQMHTANQNRHRPNQNAMGLRGRGRGQGRSAPNEMMPLSGGGRSAGRGSRSAAQGTGSERRN